MKLSFISPHHNTTIKALEEKLVALYGNVPPHEADVIIPLGGDGMMLHTLHNFHETTAHFFGMNCGSVGFLMNTFAADNLKHRLQQTEKITLTPLTMEVEMSNGEKHTGFAINEVYLFRETHQTAKLKLMIDGQTYMEPLISDGLLVATPAGSTAYNLSLNGPILPLTSRLLALTPISAFRPRRWRGALIPNGSTVTIEVVDAAHRPVSAVTDFIEFRDIVRVTITNPPTKTFTLLFDKDKSLEKRIFAEQFL